MFKNILFVLLLSWHPIATAMHTPLYGSLEYPSPANPDTQGQLFRRFEPGCWNCFSDRYAETGEGILSGCWIEHSQLYLFCLPCLRLGGRDCLGLCGIGIVATLVLAGAAAVSWYIYERSIGYFSPETPVGQPEPTNRTDVIRQAPVCFHWGLSRSGDVDLSLHMATVGLSNETLAWQQVILDHADFYPRSYLLLCGNEETELDTCIGTLDRERHKKKNRLLELEVFLNQPDWHVSKSTQVLPSHWAQWFSGSLTELCLHAGKIVHCDQ